MKKNRYSISNNHKGFTMIETLVVMVILAVLATFAIPAYTRFLPNYRLKLAAQDIYANLQAAKVESIKHNTSLFVVFDPADGNNGSYARATAPTVDLEQTYKGSVTYGSMDGSTIVDFSPVGDRAIFNSRGMAENPGSVYIKNTQDNSYKIEVTSSGAISLKKWNSSNSAYE